MKKVIIVGAGGQDGTLLSRALAHSGHDVVGVRRNGPVNILDGKVVRTFVRELAPDEVYYLAAFHHASDSPELLAPHEIWTRSFDVHVNGLLNVLEAIRNEAPAARLFYAASSLVFGEPERSPQDESTPCKPVCAYGISKTAGLHCCRFYRQRLGVFAAAGILYNHESALRSASFISRRIIRAAVEIKNGRAKELVLGDLSALTDWGYAPDFVDAMQRIVHLEQAGEFVVATGTPHRVLDWVEGAFGAVGLGWRDYVREDRSRITRPKGNLVGDSSKLQRMTGWKPTTSFEQMIAEMVRLEGEA